MRVTICELPHEPRALAIAWSSLAVHTARARSELVLLPEFAFVDPVWEDEQADIERWAAARAQGDAWLARLGELDADHVVGTRPVTRDGRALNEGYLWSAAGGVRPLRAKFFVPDDPGCREARWFERGDPAFPTFHAGALTFGLNVCSELWAVETFGEYAARGTHAILAPRATSGATIARWRSLGVVAAVRAGAYCISSNRVDEIGEYGGRSWIISPAGEVLASTSAATPYATVDIDLDAPAEARLRYPCNVFREEVVPGR